MRVAVIGGGGMGGYLAARLARAGEDVAVVARGATLAALGARGLTLRSPGGQAFTLPVAVTDDAARLGPAELVLFCVKAYDLDAAARHLPPLVGADTVVLPVQNGIDHVERLARIVGAGPLVGGVSYVAATAEGPGLVVHRGGTRLLVGELDGCRSGRVEALVGVLRRAEIGAEVAPDIRTALWEKFVVACASSGMTAVTRLPLGSILAHPESRALIRGLMEEVVAVGRARGDGLSGDVADACFRVLAGFDPGARASQYHDLVAGRRLEVEALNGAVVRLGRACGVPTPLNFAIYAALKPYAEGSPAPLGARAERFSP